MNKRIIQKVGVTCVLIISCIMRMNSQVSVLNPYKPDAYRYKGQTHCHTQISDGHLKKDSVMRKYQNEGYNFVCITDHDFCWNWHHRLDKGDVFDNIRVPGIVNIPGEEAGMNSQDGRHMIEIGLKKDYWDQRQMEFKSGTAIDGWYNDPGLTFYIDWQRRIDLVNNQGGIAILAHPGDSGPWTNDAFSLTGYTGIEANDPNENSKLWDKLLSKGKKIWGFAKDDFHGPEGGLNIGWIVVKSAIQPASDEAFQNDILENIKSGNFYSVYNPNGVGPTITDIFFKDCEEKIEMFFYYNSESCTVKFIGKDGTVLQSTDFTQSGNKTQKVGYVCQGSEKYVRIEIWDDKGNVAYSQPMFIIPSTVGPSIFGTINDCKHVGKGAFKNKDNSSLTGYDQYDLTFSWLCNYSPIYTILTNNNVYINPESGIKNENISGKTNTGSETITLKLDGNIAQDKCEVGVKIAGNTRYPTRQINLHRPWVNAKLFLHSPGPESWFEQDTPPSQHWLKKEIPHDLIANEECTEHGSDVQFVKNATETEKSKYWNRRVFVYGKGSGTYFNANLEYKLGFIKVPISSKFATAGSAPNAAISCTRDRYIPYGDPQFGNYQSDKTETFIVSDRIFDGFKLEDYQGDIIYRFTFNFSQGSNNLYPSKKAICAKSLFLVMIPKEQTIHPIDVEGVKKGIHVRIDKEILDGIIDSFGPAEVNTIKEKYSTFEVITKDITTECFRDMKENVVLNTNVEKVLQEENAILNQEISKILSSNLNYSTIKEALNTLVSTSFQQKEKRVINIYAEDIIASIKSSEKTKTIKESFVKELNTIKDKQKAKSSEKKINDSKIKTVPGTSANDPNTSNIKQVKKPSTNIKKTKP